MVSSIAVFSGKGGVGKTTLSAALAQISGSALLDCDPQLTASDWGDRRPDPLPVIAAPLGRVPVLLREYPRAVIDTPGALVGNVATALRVVDVILLVTGDRQPEIDAVPASIDLAQQAGRPIVVVINRMHPFTDPGPLRDFLTGLGVTVAPVVIRERSPHYKAWGLGQTAAEFDPESAAASEIRELWTWLAETAHGQA